MAWGIAFGELLRGGLWGVFCGYVGMRTHFLSINPANGLKDKRGCGRSPRPYIDLVPIVED